MKKKTTFAGWMARICAIAAILFVSMFALDSFEHGTLMQKIAAFGMHLIPSVILFMILVLAWKFEFAGGVIFILLGIGLAPFIYNMNFDRTQSVTVALQVIALINLPFVIVGALFVYSYYKLRHKKLST